MSDTRAVAATGSAPRPAVRAGTPADAAVVTATAATGDGRPASLLPWEDTTVLGRLVDQLTGLGVRRVVVVTRPGWHADVTQALDSARAEVRTSPSVAEDLRAVAEVARGVADALVVAQGDIVTQREALAKLLADPRVSTGILAGGRRRPMVYKVRGRRGRVISAGSPYHSVYRPTGAFLGVLKVAPADLGTLAEAAERVAPLSADPPPAWVDELERKAGNWRAGLARAAANGEEADEAEAPIEAEDPVEGEEPEVVLSEEDEARLRHRLAVAPDDAVPLLLVGLVRGGARVGPSYLRRLFWARPLSDEAVADAAEAIKDFDEERALLASAVKSSDGFFTTFFVSPYSRYIARWAARRGLTPNQVTTVSLFIGLLAAAGFATGERLGLVAGAVLLQIAFTTDCVDGQLARYTRQFSKLGAWLDSVFDRAKEYVAFAGLAIGASRAGDPVWLLACAAIALQTARHMSDFSFGGSQQQVLGATPQPPVEQPLDAAAAAAERRRNEAQGDDAPPAPPPRSLPDRVLSAWHALDRAPGVRWLKKMIAFPIGERFAVISITAALFTPRVTFIALLAWGGLAAAYTQTGRILRSIR